MSARVSNCSCPSRVCSGSVLSETDAYDSPRSADEFDSELERLNVSLVLENQSLQSENRQLSSLLKDYEGTLEAVMAKFRAHAVSV